MYLNCKTFFSYRYGTFSTEALVKEGAEAGATAMALTNINNTCDLWDFYTLCREAGIRPLLGCEVRNESRELLGKVEDVVFEGGPLVGIVLKVGQGSTEDRYVAIDPSSISVTYIEGEDKWRAKVNAHPDQLKSAPEFRYQGKWKR